MADLDSFFKKKDKRKKKAPGAPAVATASTTAAPTVTAPVAAAAAATGTAATVALPVAPEKVGVAADGDWIELEDAKAVVNTGGRTVKELNRYAFFSFSACGRANGRMGGLGGRRVRVLWRCYRGVPPLVHSGFQRVGACGLEGGGEEGAVG